MLIEKGQIVECVANTAHWSDDTGRWMNVIAGDVGLIKEYRFAGVGAGHVYDVLLLRQRATIVVNPQYIYDKMCWNLAPRRDYP